MVDATNTSTIRTAAINRSRRCISLLVGGGKWQQKFEWWSDAFEPNTLVLQHSIRENRLALLPIRHRRHAAGNTGLRQLGLVDCAHFPWLIFIIHHRAALAFRHG